MNQYYRKSHRLDGYDYTQPGAYFITLVTVDRTCLFGQCVRSLVHHTPAGIIVQQEWLRTPRVRREVDLGEFIVMPNHFHAIVWIHERIGERDSEWVGAHGRAPLQRPKRSLGSLIAGFKSATTKQINALRAAAGQPVWQRNYFDRIIRSEGELSLITDYIRANPLGWEKDSEYTR